MDTKEIAESARRHDISFDEETLFIDIQGDLAEHKANAIIHDWTLYEELLFSVSGVATPAEIITAAKAQSISAREHLLYLYSLL